METRTSSKFSWQRACRGRISLAYLDVESHIRQCTSFVFPQPKVNTWIRPSLLPRRTRSGSQNGALQERNQHLKTGSCGRSSGANTATATLNFHHPRAGGSTQVTEYGHGTSTRNEMWSTGNPIIQYMPTFY